MASGVLHLIYCSCEDFYNACGSFFIPVCILTGVFACAGNCLSKVMFQKPYPKVRVFWQVILNEYWMNVLPRATKIHLLRDLNTQLKIIKSSWGSVWDCGSSEPKCTPHLLLSRRFQYWRCTFGSTSLSFIGSPVTDCTAIQFIPQASFTIADKLFAFLSAVFSMQPIYHKLFFQGNLTF